MNFGFNDLRILNSCQREDPKVGSIVCCSQFVKEVKHWCMAVALRDVHDVLCL